MEGALLHYQAAALLAPSGERALAAFLTRAGLPASFRVR